MGINCRTLDGSTYHDNADADEDILSSTPSIQGRTNERNPGNRANLVQGRDYSYPNTGVGPMEVGSESVVLKESV